MNSTSSYLFIGVGGQAVAIDRSTGAEIWRRKLKSQTYVTISFDGHSLFAGCNGELFCLDPATGEVRWHNKLPRLGTGLISFGGSVESSLTGATEEMAAATTATAAVIAATAAG